MSQPLSACGGIYSQKTLHTRRLNRLNIKEILYWATASIRQCL